MKSIERISDCTNDKLPYNSPTFKRRTAASYFLDYPENNSPKKDKKWSFGSLFRRKKKDNSESSSDDDGQKKKSKKKKKVEKKSKLKSLGTFDHIVLPSNAKNNANGYCEDVGILSDPTGGFGSYSGRPLPKIPTPGSDISSRLSSNHMQLSRQSLESSDSVSLSKQNRRGRTKARAEIRRGYMKGDSSSDDESQVSHFKSDDSLRNQRDSSCNRRSRTARTERYIRRLSKDEERILNKEAQLLRAYKSDAENHYEKSPVLHSKIKYSNSDPFPNLLMGLSTIPPREHLHNNSKTKYANKLKNVKYPVVNLEVPQVNNNQRSYSCDADIHKSPSPDITDNVIHAQLALTKPQGRNNISLIELSHLDKQPPPPPPRDPRRVLPKQDNRPLSFNFDKDVQQKSKHHPIKSKSLNLHPGYRLSNSEDCISNTQPNIQLIPRPSSVTPLRKQDEFQYYMDKKPRSRKPILIHDNMSNENTRNAQNFWKQKDRANSPQIFTSQTHVRTNIFLPSVLKQDIEDESIPIQPIDYSNNNNNLKNSNISHRPISNSPILNKINYNLRTTSPISGSSTSNNSICQIPKTSSSLSISNDQKVPYCSSPILKNVTTSKLNIINKRTSSPIPKNPATNPSISSIFTTPIVTDSFMSYNSNSNPINSTFGNPNVKHLKLNNPNVDINCKLNNPNVVSSKLNLTSNINTSNKSIINHENRQKSLKDIPPECNTKTTEECVKERKSSNLEDALDELEAIYKSLHLGDEDLLERAEQREKSIIATQKFSKSKSECYPGWNREDSFNYEPFDNKKYIPDRKTDDMAFRKMNNNKKPNNAAIQSSVSYLLATPSQTDDVDGIKGKFNDNEPDVTLDDVVFRNIKHVNNTLKIQDPQPPFGIPIGPITPSANSDYLHAIPDELPKPKSKIPDIVKDDLAYRNLRKDQLKEVALPPFNKYDFLNNNNNAYSDTKKKRAVRSLSANIYNLMHNSFDDTNGTFDTNNGLFDCSSGLFDSTSGITESKRKIDNNIKLVDGLETCSKKNDNLNDIADVMEIARQILKEKDEKLCNRTFLSDTDTRRFNRHAFNRRPFISLPNNEKVEKNSLDDLINALAAEARETTEKLTSELNKSSEVHKTDLDHLKEPDAGIKSNENSEGFGLNKSKSFDAFALDKSTETVGKNKSQTSEEFILDLSKEIDKIQFDDCNENTKLNAYKIDESAKLMSDKSNGNRFNHNKEVFDLDKKLSDIEAVSDRAKLCGELLDGCSVEPIQMEEVQHIESVANVVITSKPLEDENDDSKLEEMDSSTSSSKSSDEHDYVNYNTDAEIERNIPFIDIDGTETYLNQLSCKSPFEENKAKLIADFQELNSFDSEMMGGDNNKREDDEEGEMTECLLVNDVNKDVRSGCVNYVTKSQIFVNENSFTYVANCDIFVNDSNQSDLCKSEFDLDEKSDLTEKSNLDTQCNSNHQEIDTNLRTEPKINDDVDVKNHRTLLDTLKSPKLVQKSNQLFEQNHCNNDDNNSSQVKNNEPKKDDDDDKGHTLDSTLNCLYNPLAFALACTYGLACTNQLVSLDVVTVLSIIFFLFSFIAAIIF